MPEKCYGPLVNTAKLPSIPSYKPFTYTFANLGPDCGSTQGRRMSALVSLGVQSKCKNNPGWTDGVYNCIENAAPVLYPKPEYPCYAPKEEYLLLYGYTEEMYEDLLSNCHMACGMCEKADNSKCYEDNAYDMEWEDGNSLCASLKRELIWNRRKSCSEMGTANTDAEKNFMANLEYWCPVTCGLCDTSRDVCEVCDDDGAAKCFVNGVFVGPNHNPHCTLDLGKCAPCYRLPAVCGECIVNGVEQSCVIEGVFQEELPECMAKFGKCIPCYFAEFAELQTYA